MTVKKLHWEEKHNPDPKLRKGPQSVKETINKGVSQTSAVTLLLNADELIKSEVFTSAVRRVIESEKSKQTNWDAVCSD